MELMEEEVKGYSDSREEEEEDQEAAEINIQITRDHQLESSNRLHHQQDAAAAASSPNFANHRLDFMDLSLATTNSNDDQLQGSGGGGGGCSSGGATPSTSEAAAGGPPVEKEHMFDKVVTPSDVGKLNRLVIPKQHAEKYFPLDSSSNEKGLLLNFEDRNGKLWRFRYSYWNSSQSYVMTKGWSRFVKEKKLDAGDIVSFQRGLGEHYRHRLYIDWRRRPDHPPDGYHHPSASSLVAPLFLPNHYSIRWGGRLYSLPSPPAAPSPVPPPPPPPPRHHDHYQQQHLNYSNHMYAFHQQQYQQFNSYSSHDQLNNPGSGSVYYLRSTPSVSTVDHQSFPGQQQQERGSAANIHSPMIIDSVPVAHHHHHQHHQHLPGGNIGVVAAAATTTAGKRLRLFGVNMECASSSSSSPPGEASSAAHVTMPPNSLPSSASRFADQRGEIRETSVLFDLDPSLQYRQQQQH